MEITNPIKGLCSTSMTWPSIKSVKPVKEGFIRIFALFTVPPDLQSAANKKAVDRQGDYKSPRFNGSNLF